MNHFTRNNVLAWMLAIITAVCAFMGIILTTPQVNTAYADAEQITQETFPDTSTWEEKIIETEFKTDDPEEVRNRLSGKFFRVHYDKNGNDYGFVLMLQGDNPNYGYQSVISKRVNEQEIHTSEFYGNAFYKDYGTYFDFICYPTDGTWIKMFYVEDENGEIAFSENLIVELIEPEVNDDLAADDKTEDENINDDKTEDENINDVKDNNKIVDTDKNQTGLAVTGSIVGVVCLGVIVYFVFIKRKK